MAYLFSFSLAPARARAVRQAAWHPHGRRWLRGPRSVLCAAVVVAAASGCETTTPPPELQDTAIVTAGNSFELRKRVYQGKTGYSATIPHTYTNRTGSKVYVDFGCWGRHDHLEIDEGGEDGSEWVFFWAPVMCLIGESFTTIEPGEVYQDTLHFFGCSSDDSCGERLALPGIASTPFRIGWVAWSSLDEDRHGFPIGGDLVPLKERVSNHFTFEVVESSH